MSDFFESPIEVLTELFDKLLADLLLTDLLLEDLLLTDLLLEDLLLADLLLEDLLLDIWRELFFLEVERATM
jgi:hypothetical protein